jgi:hypothetical protein
MRRRGCPPAHEWRSAFEHGPDSRLPNPTASAAQTLVDDNEGVFHALGNGLAGVPAGSV